MAEGTGITGKDWMGLALGGASFLPMLFGGGNDELDSLTGDLRASTDRSAKVAKQSEQDASSVLAPAMDYLKAITGGDRSAVLAATMPERRRVIDQYATAKKSVAEFAPRGGSQAGAFVDLEASKAGDLSVLGANARKEGMDKSAGLVAALRQAGVNAESVTSGNLNSMIQTVMEQQAQRGASASSIGEGLASLIGMIFL